MLVVLLAMILLPIVGCIHDFTMTRRETTKQTYIVHERDSRITDARNFCKERNGTLPVITSPEDVEFLVALTLAKDSRNTSTWIGESSMSFLRNKDYLWKNESSNAIKCSVCLFVYRTCCGLVVTSDATTYETTVECKDCQWRGRLVCVFDDNAHNFESINWVFQESSLDVLANGTVRVRSASEDLTNIVFFLLIVVIIANLTAYLVVRQWKIQNRLRDVAVVLSETAVEEASAPTVPLRRPASLDVRSNYEGTPSAPTSSPRTVASWRMRQLEEEDKPPAYEDVVKVTPIQ
jgi:hypothetical protein